MPIEETVAEVTDRLRQGRFSNEQAISQGIVLRLLQDLGWNTWDTSIVWPEFQTGEGRADFALCHPPSKPAVFGLVFEQMGDTAKSVACMKQVYEADYGYKDVATRVERSYRPESQPS